MSKRSDFYELVPEFAALLAGPSGVSVAAVLDDVTLQRERASAAPKPDFAAELDGPQALTIARDWGLEPTSDTAALYEMLYDGLPELRELLAAGGPFLDVGSGVGGALLGTLLAFPQLRASGVELVPEVATELLRRAQAAGFVDPQITATPLGRVVLLRRP